MTLMTKNDKILTTLRYLPRKISSEIIRLAEQRRGGIGLIREINIRCEGVCTVTLIDERIRLASTVSREETDCIVNRLLNCALYAQRENIASGFISLEGGIRVGVSGNATYDGGRLVGIGDISSILFRIPTGECAFSEELFAIFCNNPYGGMLIYSLPGVGKTTALRSLATKIGGQLNRRVAIVDRRGEFPRENFRSCQVDVLSGYQPAEGMEIATRTLSPELIIIDEIGKDDADALINTVRCGIPLLASAHAGDLKDLESRKNLARILSMKVFSTFVGIKKQNGKYKLTVDRI